MYLRDTDCVMMLYDDEGSLNQLLTFWKPVIAQQAPERCLIVLVHTKIDEVPSDLDRLKKATHQLKAKVYQEVSAKSGQGVQEVFQ